MISGRPFLAAGLSGLLALGGFVTGDANAQQIFRIVGPDGRVTFSDKPPLEPTARTANAPVIAMPSGGRGDTSNLPFELRQAASRYPVTLYTSPGCGPCGAGRAMLSSRGIPFAEKTITSNDDIEALKRLAGAASVPFLTIGGQQLKGFSEAEWGQFLDAAGYPKTSQLPAGFAQAPAAPLVAVQEPEARVRPAPAAATEAPRIAAPAPAPAPADNPTGIKF